MHTANKLIIIILLSCITLIPPAHCGGTEQAVDTAGPQQAEAHIRQGDEYLSAGEHGEAVEEYTAALALDPHNAEAYMGRGKALHFGRELYSSAADDYSAAIALEPENQDAYYYRALAHIDNGAWERAEADLSTAIELMPALPMTYYLRAWCNIFIASRDSPFPRTTAGAGLEWEMLAPPRVIERVVPSAALEMHAPPAPTPLPPDAIKGKHPALPYIKMQPLSGPVGSQLFIYGWGFRGNEDGITVTWDGEIIIVNIRAEADGSIIIDGSSVPAGSTLHDGPTRAAVYVPPATQGIHLLGVYGSSFTPIGTIPDIAFEVVPAIELSVQPRNEGTEVTAAGRGFAAGEMVTLTIAEGQMGKGRADEKGSFEISAIVPLEKDKEYSLKATGDKGSAAQADFAIASRKIVPLTLAPPLEEAYFNRGFALFRQAQAMQAMSGLEHEQDSEQAQVTLRQWQTVAADFSRTISAIAGTAPAPAEGGLYSYEEILEQAVADYNKAAALSTGTGFAERARKAIEIIEKHSGSAEDTG